MMTAALLLQGVPASPGMPVAAPALSAAQLTMPIVDAICKITYPDGRDYEFIMRQTGGRGYNVARNGATYRSRTPVKHEIIRDTAGVFNGFEFQTGPRETWPGRVEALKRSGPMIGRIVQVETIRADRDGRYAILLRRNWPQADVQALGFCDVKKTPQAPLNAAETEEATRQ